MTEDKPEESKQPVKPEIVEANQRWLKLMNTQADIHRQSRDPRLYRQSSKQKLIAPLSSPPTSKQ